jgi:hypothetical protein
VISSQLMSTAKGIPRDRSYSFACLYPFGFLLIKKLNLALDFILLQINLKYVRN